MVNQKLREYIEDAFSKGFTKQYILERLKAAGYVDEQIEKGFNSVNPPRRIKTNYLLVSCILLFFFGIFIFLLFSTIINEYLSPHKFTPLSNMEIFEGVDFSIPHEWWRNVSTFPQEATLVNIIEIEERAGEIIYYNCTKGPAYDLINYSLKEPVEIFFGKYTTCDYAMVYQLNSRLKGGNSEGGCLFDIDEVVPAELKHYYFVKLLSIDSSRYNTNLSGIDYPCFVRFLDRSVIQGVETDYYQFIVDAETKEIIT